MIERRIDIKGTRGIVGVVGAIGFAILFLSGWWPLKKQGNGGGHNYSDLHSVQRAANCFKIIGRAVFRSTNSCTYQYGEFLLRFLNWTHLTNVSAPLLGGIFFIVIATGIVLLASLSTNDLASGALGIALILSTGPWLLFERGNFDLLILLILFLALCTSNTALSPLTILLVAMTSLMKFYTWPLLLILYIIEKNKATKVMALILSLAAVPLMFRDIVNANGHPNPMFAAFGLPAPGLWLNFFAWRFNIPLKLSMLGTYLVGTLFILLFGYLFYFSRVKERFLFSRVEKTTFSDWQRKVFIFSTTVFLSCYLAGMSYDYRLIYLIISLLILNNGNRFLLKSKSFIGIEVGGLWLTYFFFGYAGAVPVLLALAGNICQFFLTIFLARILFVELFSSKINSSL